MSNSDFAASLRQDTWHAWRLLAKTPGFSAVVVITLALGIGATTAIFSVAASILLRSVPIRHASQVVLVEWSGPDYPRTFQSYTSYGDTADERRNPPTGASFPFPFVRQVEAADMFRGVAAFAGAGPLAISGNGPASIVRGQAVSGDFFQTLGIRAAAGRLLGPADDKPAAAPAIVLNYGYWQRAFGGKPCVGHVVKLNGVEFTIVGIAEKTFDSLSFASVYDLWLPLAAEPLVNPAAAEWQNDAHSAWVLIAGRLKQGVSPSQAQAEIDALFQHQLFRQPAHAVEPHIVLRSAQEALGGAAAQAPQYQDPLRLLMAGVALLLLISSTNVAGLLLSRATARRREIAIRLALGARPLHLVRQLFTESLVLASLGGAFGIVLAYWGARLLMRVLLGGAVNQFGIAAAFDWRALAVCAAASMMAGILCGVAPAVSSLRVDVDSGLRQNAAPKSQRAVSRWFRWGAGLSALQAALAVVLLMAAGLLIHSLVNLKNINPGFDTRNTLTFHLYPELAGYGTARINALNRDLQEEIGAVPGVLGVTYSQIPMLTGFWSSNSIGRGAGKPSFNVDWVPVGPGFFQTMKLHIMAGRALDDADATIAAENQRANAELSKTKPGGSLPAFAARPLPVVVNEHFVRKYFPNENPLGLEFGGAGKPIPGDKYWHPGYVIVGVAADAKYNSLRRDIQPTMYVPMAKTGAEFEVRTATDPRLFVAGIRNIVRRYDPTLAMTAPVTQSELVDGLLRRERLVTQLSSVFGVLALGIVCVGIYGLLSFEVARRTREIGIRMALGARRGHVIRAVTWQAGVIIALGMAAGMALAQAGLRLLNSLLYGVGLADFETLGAVIVLVLGAGIMGAFVPARRASSVDPLIALRQE